ncbi:hypothetical protein JK165_08680 [Acetobacter okinawensis]|uniref:hypothetical protein n=1 Tax=Acetobacter okinawensis TaxID=1076594 RepID=UPI001BA5F90B|nr:hypothetical protein [Acetobacter okinawensis]MBS0966159.1 hypothetical protein [Acetobacter okinawensis]
MCHIEEAEHRAEQRVRAEIGEGQITLPTYEAFCNSAKGLMIGEFKVQVPDVQCSECEGSGFEDAEEELECSTCDGTGSVALQIPVPWTTIKEIYRTITEEYGPKPAIDAAREVG